MTKQSVIGIGPILVAHAHTLIPYCNGMLGLTATSRESWDYLSCYSAVYIVLYT